MPLTGLLYNHNLKPEEVLERVRRMWSLDGPFPIPLFKVRCPICGNDEILMKNQNFFKRGKGYRCDVAFKCFCCSYVWIHGVAIPQAMFEQHQKSIYSWREMSEVLNGQRREKET